MIINNSNVAKIVKIVKYVNVRFVYETGSLDPISLIPGNMLIPPIEEPVFLAESTGRIYYKVIYDWSIGSNSIPLLVPNVDSTFVASYCDFDIPSTLTIITCDEYGNQSVVGSFLLNSEKPLYFIGSTIDSGITKEVFISFNRTMDNYGNYIHNLSFNVSNANIPAGGQKQFRVDMKLFKDMICSKYLGTISFDIKLISTVGPGE